MSCKKKLVGSWEKQRAGEVHSPEGVEDLRKIVKDGLMNFYCSIAENRFRIDALEEDDRFEDMRIMSLDKAPWKFLLRNGSCCAFELPGTDQIHFLPYVMKGGVNMYGELNHWSPVPYGYDKDKKREYPKTMEKIMALELGHDNSVIWLNGLFGRNDWDYIEQQVGELVSGQLTENQLLLLLKMPFVFNVTEDNELSAKNYFLAIAESKPSIFTNRNGEDVTPVIVQTGVKIDPGLFDLIDSFHAKIMQFLGLPCVPITKRAQQTVSEVQSNDSEIRLRRGQYKKMLDYACKRMEKVFGIQMECVDVLEELDEQRAEQMQQTIGQQSKEKEESE